MTSYKQLCLVSVPEPKQYSTCLGTPYDVPFVNQIVSKRIPALRENLVWYDTFCIVASSEMSYDNCETDKYPKRLYEYGKSSMVGKGADTVFDAKVRKSVEFTEFEMDGKCMTHIKSKVEQMIKSMNAGSLVDITPHKIVLYKKGDFFAKHIDSTHVNNQNMSCVVEIPSKWSGNGLIIDGQIYTGDNNMNISVFDHDIEHEVAIVESGVRISITFDLVVDPVENFNLNDDEMKMEINSLVNMLKENDMNTIGWFSSHVYMGRQGPKGIDAKILDLFDSFIVSFKRQSLYKSSTNDQWVTQAVNNVYMENAGELYRETSGTYTEEQCIVKNEEINTIPFCNYEPPEECYSIFDQSQCLGGIFVMHTPRRTKHILSGNDEIHLGNEGFQGDVYENVFFTMKLQE